MIIRGGTELCAGPPNIRGATQSSVPGHRMFRGATQSSVLGRRDSWIPGRATLREWHASGRSPSRFTPGRHPNAAPGARKFRASLCWFFSPAGRGAVSSVPLHPLPDSSRAPILPFRLPAAAPASLSRPGEFLPETPKFRISEGKYQKARPLLTVRNPEAKKPSPPRLPPRYNPLTMNDFSPRPSPA